MCVCWGGVLDIKAGFFCLFVVVCFFSYHACVEILTASCASGDCFGVQAVTGWGTNFSQTSAWSRCCFVYELVLGEPSAKSGLSASSLTGNASLRKS